MLLARGVGADFRNDLSVPGTDSQRAFDLLHERFPERAGDTMQVVLHTSDGLDAPAVRSAVDAGVRQMSTRPHVTSVRSPFGPGPQSVSAEGTIGFITIQFDRRASALPTSAVDHVRDDAGRDIGHGSPGRVRRRGSQHRTGPERAAR